MFTLKYDILNNIIYMVWYGIRFGYTPGICTYNYILSVKNNNHVYISAYLISSLKP